MHLKVHSASLIGVKARVIDIEVDLSPSHTGRFQVVGLPDKAVRESGERVRAALRNCGFRYPRGRITVNMAPADLPKQGSGYDLPIALAVLGLSGGLEPRSLEGWLISGELSLDGRVRPVRGALPMALEARKLGCRRLLVPLENTGEAAAVEEIEVYPARSLQAVVRMLSDPSPASPVEVDRESLTRRASPAGRDFRDVKAQQAAKRALEVACAGGHNVIMIGPPGSGKTMLARRIPGLLPALSFSEALETTAVHSVAGLLRGRRFIGEHPFRAPHHTISAAGLLGGSSVPRPGEISLAHNGVLFLDELPEFNRQALEGLREPLEAGEVRICRVAGSVTYPARFMLVAAMNPCPCGFWNSQIEACACTPIQIRRYLSKISGPLLDRIDLHLEVPAVEARDLQRRPDGESSRRIGERVAAARRSQQRRFKARGTGFNARMGAAQIRKFCRLSPEVSTFLDSVLTRLRFSARGYDRILKVARTVADLAGSSEISADHLAEAVGYRSLDRENWGRRD